MKIPNDLSERFEGFAAEVIKGIAKIQRNFAGRHIAGQLIRSATSAGANYEEACGAESRQDFIRLRRRARALPVDECVNGVCANLESKYHCFGGFRHWRITLRSLGVGGYSFGGNTGLARGAPYINCKLF